MQFYLIPAAQGQPAIIAGTQETGRAACKNRGLKFKPAEMAHEVPTDKAGLGDYVNNLLAQVHIPISQPDEVSHETPIFEPAPPAQGFSNRFDENKRGNLASVMGVRMTVLEAVELIEELEGMELGRVCLAAAQRLQEVAS